MDKKDKLYKIVNRPGQKREQTFQRFHNPEHPRYKRYHKRFPHILENVVGPKVLDAGCGTGLLFHLLLDRDDIKEMHGLDLQKAIIEEANENVKDSRVIFHQGFVEELNFENEYFNTVVLGETLEHVYSVDKTLSEAARVLKSAGRIIITCPYKGATSELHVRSIDRKFIRKFVEKYFSIEALEVIKYPGEGPQGVFCLGIK